MSDREDRTRLLTLDVGVSRSESQVDPGGRGDSHLSSPRDEEKDNPQRTFLVSCVPGFPVTPGVTWNSVR